MTLNKNKKHVFSADSVPLFTCSSPPKCSQITLVEMKPHLSLFNLVLRRICSYICRLNTKPNIIWVAVVERERDRKRAMGNILESESDAARPFTSQKSTVTTKTKMNELFTEMGGKRNEEKQKPLKTYENVFWFCAAVVVGVLFLRIYLFTFVFLLLPLPSACWFS